MARDLRVLSVPVEVQPLLTHQCNYHLKIFFEAAVIHQQDNSCHVYNVQNLANKTDLFPPLAFVITCMKTNWCANWRKEFVLVNADGRLEFDSLEVPLTTFVYFFFFVIVSCSSEYEICFCTGDSPAKSLL